MSATQGVGDDHPGQWLPFWRQACEDGRRYACPYLADLELAFCNRGSGWACNEAGLLHIALSRSGEDLRRLDPAGAVEPLSRGCKLGFEAACRNLRHAERQRHRRVRGPAADSRRLSDHLERQQGRNPRTGAVGVVCARVPGRLARHMPADGWGTLTEQSTTLSAGVVPASCGANSFCGY